MSVRNHHSRLGDFSSRFAEFEMTETWYTHIMLYIASDHNGFARKKELLAFFASQKIACKDLGPFSLDMSDDYTDYAKKVAINVQRGQKSRGILVCGSGNGMAMMANRFQGIRAALCWNVPSAKKSREDEDANVLVLPSWWTSVPVTKKIVTVWLSTQFTNIARYRRRIRKLDRKT